MAAYTFSCFSIFTRNYEDEEKRVLIRQDVLMFLLQFAAFGTMYLATKDIRILFLYAVLTVILLAVILLYNLIYPNVSRLVVNNMCMLMAIGFIMITRLSYSLAVKQFLIVSASVAISLVIPVIIRKVKALSEWKIFYAIAGVVMLGVVIIVGRVTGGAMLNVAIGGFTLQPSELVKIIFVFFVAASLKTDTSFKNIVITTAVAAMHVLILVVSKDLGAALIIFAVYLVMLYVATRKLFYFAGGLLTGCIAAVVAYKLFNHVRVRVLVWKNPFTVYNEGGYQVAQSLMAIGTGSWFGMGLFQGAADQIPVAESDFIFSAIAEEMGLIFALGLILVCVSVYMMFLNIAMQLRDSFYKLVALGLGTCYIFQIFLTIGGVTKFIPSTGVTLPLVSYGGTSVLSTIIMFAIIQGLYVLREDEEEDIERKKLQRRRTSRSGSAAGEPARRERISRPKEEGRREKPQQTNGWRTKEKGRTQPPKKRTAASERNTGRKKRSQ